MAVNNIVKEVFAQTTCLQGQEFGAYILWETNINVKVNVQLPDDLELSGLNNVVTFENDKRKLSVSEFERNGFIGMRIKTNILEKYSIDKELVFEVIDLSTQEIITIKKVVHLFRPAIEIQHTPKEIVITNNDSGFHISDKIELFNSGEGTALIWVKFSEESNVKIGLPASIENFRKNFLFDLTNEFDHINEKFPNYKWLIEDMKKIIKVEVPEDSYISAYEKLKIDLEDAMENDFDFEQDIYNAFNNSLLRNLPYFSKLESIYEYFKEVQNQKIIIANSPNLMEIPIGEHTLNGDIHITDLALKTYPKLHFNIKIKTDLQTSIPLFKLFKSKRYLGD